MKRIKNAHNIYKIHPKQLYQQKKPLFDLSNSKKGDLKKP